MSNRARFLAAARATLAAEPDTIEGFHMEELLHIGMACAESKFLKLLPDELTPTEREYAAAFGMLSPETVARLTEEAYPRKR